MPRHRDVTPDEIHQRILNSALDCFLQHGIKGSTTKEIAKQANVSEMTLFRHFETKQVLVETLFEPVMQEHRHLHQGDDLEHSLVERLRFVRQHRDVLRVMFNESVTTDQNLMERLLSDVKQQLTNTSIQIPVEVAIRVISGLMLSALVIPQDEVLDRDVVQRVLIFMNAGKETKHA